jgi:hypothetical protein
MGPFCRATRWTIRQKWRMIYHGFYTLMILHVWKMAGWWFGTFFIFPYIGNNNPNWLSYFSEG